MGDRAVYRLAKQRPAATLTTTTTTTTNANQGAVRQLSLILLVGLIWLACVASIITAPESASLDSSGGQSLPGDLNGRSSGGAVAPSGAGVEEPPATVLASLKNRAVQFWHGARGNVPSYFDFEQFVKRFKRNHEASEAYLRRSIFMHKIMDIIRNQIQLRLGLTRIRLTVNKFSDMTRGEFNRIYQRVRPSLLYLGDTSNQMGHPHRGHHLPMNPNEQLGEHWNARCTDDLREEDWCKHEERLEREEADQLLDNHTKSAGANLSESDGVEGARRLMDEYVSELRPKLASELEGAQLGALIEAAAREEFRSGVEIEHDKEKSSTGTIGTTAGATVATATTGARPKPRKLPKPGRLKSPPHDEHDNLEKLAPYEPPKLEDDQLAGLDWSRHACFHEVYEQDPNCGNCYVIAATSVAEFYACSQAGAGDKQITRIKFSKDYVLHCAQKFVPTVMGCLGGSVFDTVRFIAMAGANKVRSWKKKRQTKLIAMIQELGGQAPTDPLDIGCPLDPDRAPMSEWGAVRVSLNPVRVHPNHWLEALEDGPLLVSMQMPPEGVDSYSGGVHDGRGCESSALFHAMVLVGYGLDEHGESYWRFRNSFGPDWGDQGHFHLSMAIPGACIVESVRIYREPCKSC